MKRQIKDMLQKMGAFEYVKYSKVFSLYESIFNPQARQKHHGELKLYRSFLSPCNLIFDIGANDGHKTAAFLEIAKKVVCCEPDPRSFHTLQTRFRSKKNRVALVNKAVSNHQGEASLSIHHGGSAFNTLNKKWIDILEKDNLQRWNEKIHFSESVSVKLITLDDLIDQYGIPDFIKIDVEGSELQVLKGLNTKVPLLSFECLLPEFMPELRQCLGHLNKLEGRAAYNIISDERLFFNDFVNADDVFKWLNQTTAPSFEILARMDTAN